MGIDTAMSLHPGSMYKEPVMYLHGGASTSSSGKVLVEFCMKKRHTILTPDLPGNGYSGPLINGKYNVEYLAEIYFEILQQKGISSAVLAGHSLGGMISLQYALLYPNNVSGLILLGTYDASPTKGNKNISREQLLSLVQKAEEKYKPGVVHDLSELDPMSEERIIEAGLESTHPESLERLIHAVLNFDVREQIRESHNIPPTLIFAGSEDRIMTVKMARRMQRRIKCSKLEIATGEHNFLLQNPEAVKKALEKHYDYLFR